MPSSDDKVGANHEQVGFAKDGASYTRGLWDRLNGADAAEAVGKTSLNELPHAISTRDARQVAANRLSVEVEELEKKLQEMSKVWSGTACHTNCVILPG